MLDRTRGEAGRPGGCRWRSGPRIRSRSSSRGCAGAAPRAPPEARAGPGGHRGRGGGRRRKRGACSGRGESRPVAGPNAILVEVGGADHESDRVTRGDRRRRASSRSVAALRGTTITGLSHRSSSSTASGIKVGSSTSCWRCSGCTARKCTMQSSVAVTVSSPPSSSRWLMPSSSASSSGRPSDLAVHDARQKAVVRAGPPLGDGVAEVVADRARPSRPGFAGRPRSRPARRRDGWCCRATAGTAAGPRWAGP